MYKSITPIKRAILSLSDKIGLEKLVTELSKNNIEIISTGGTSKVISEMGIDVVNVSSLTKFPEIMDGRIKTLHPQIHGGILAKRNKASHLKALSEYKIKKIDLVIVNLYPFDKTLKTTSVQSKLIENIDIGGSTLIRAAAKNFEFITVVVDPNDYPELIQEIIQKNGISYSMRKKLSAKAFSYTANYDAHIASWMIKETSNNKMPKYFPIPATLNQELRYGENPHQRGALYKNETNTAGPANSKIIQGKSLSYNNINDANSAFNLVNEFEKPTTVIIKHANPCGVASGISISQTWENALKCDPNSAFGGIVAINRILTIKMAKYLTKVFTEVIIAPEIESEAIEIFKSKPNLRLLISGYPKIEKNILFDLKTINGGFIIQDKDDFLLKTKNLKVVTKRKPSEKEIEDLLFAWKVSKHVKSNAIVYAKNEIAFGIGAGQMSRIDSAKIASQKTIETGNYSTQNSVVASDAFIPFPDTLKEISKQGAKALIQPGGSIKDKEIIELANTLNLAMIFTSYRHFNH